MAFRLVGLFAAVALLAVATLPVSGQAQQPSQQPQEKRIALVIGNGAYTKAPLATAANDAGLVAQTLQAAGFEVIGARDLDGDTLRGSFRDFIQKAEASGPDTVAMVYLSGYGLQLAGENYFIPVDSKIERDTDIPTEGLRLNDYMRQLAALPLKAGVVVLDIARQQPFIDGNAQIASGLALVDPEPKMLIAFNAAPGTVAPEEQGAYGAYAQALAEMIRAGGLPLPELFDRVRLRVNETTKGAQVPWDAQKVDAPFVFFDRASDAPPQATPEQAAAARNKPIKDMGAQDAYAAALERDTLQGYEDFLNAYAGDPMAKRVRVIVAARREAITWRRTYRTDTPDAYWSYLRRYPHGPHAADARRRLSILSAALEPPQSFAMIDYDVPPPPPDEIVYVDRPVLMFSDPDFDFAPPPPPPVYYLPPPPEDFIDLPPPYYSDDLFILPQPIFVPIPIFVRPPIYVRPPQHNFIFANIHNRAVIDNQINRRGPGGFNRPGPNGPAGQRPSPQFNAGTALPGAVQRRATLIQEGKAQRPASSFINPRANVGNVDRRAPLPGPRKFGPAANTPPAAPGARTMTPAT
ncbi:caspase family protein, partial [Afipia felis]|uniref:caspase family protein n=1 Tax=Afipia felis TaxID=1035 RepID=UPI0009E39383